MTGNQPVELEAKFWVRFLPAIESRLIELGAALCQPRILERNLRFDTPQGDLRRARKVLRLRQDSGITLTYKGPPDSESLISRRTEIEIRIDSYDAAEQFLQAIGYQVVWVYEKYRTIYLFMGVHIMLDELPYGNFVEIEGSDVPVIQQACHQLALSWDARITDSYSQIFQALNDRGGNVANLTFENFPGWNADLTRLNYATAD